MSKTLALTLVLVFLTASTTITFLPAKAENKTITVPDDSNDCISDRKCNERRYDIVKVRNL